MDLKAMFGDKYAVSLEESWKAETPANRREFLKNNQQWRYFEIKGKYGVVYLYSKDTLAVFVRVPQARRLHAFLAANGEFYTRCDEGITYITTLKRVRTILRLIKAKRRKAYGENERLRIAAHMAAMRRLWGKNFLQERGQKRKTEPIFIGTGLDPLAGNRAFFTPQTFENTDAGQASAGIPK